MSKVKMNTSTSRELPMPTATKAASTEQAQAILQLCANKLKSRVGAWSESQNGVWNGHDFITEGRQFVIWLDSWESAFSTLLQQSMPSMRQEDVEQCRILKANHLSCTVLAALLCNDRDTIERDSRSVIGLATAVLERPSSTDANVERRTRSNDNVSMAEPLQIVAAYSGSNALRDQASRLLYHHYQTNARRKTTSPESSSSSPAWHNTSSRASSRGRFQG